MIKRLNKNEMKFVINDIINPNYYKERKSDMNKYPHIKKKEIYKRGEERHE